MPSTYSPNLRIELIASGEQANTWGITTNNNLGTLIEQSIAGLVQVDVTAGNVTLTALNGVSDESRNMILDVVGLAGTPRKIYAPAVSKVYVVANGADDTINVDIVGGTAGYDIEPGFTAFLYTDGTDFYSAAGDSLPLTGGTLTGPLLGTDATFSGDVEGDTLVAGTTLDVGTNATVGGTLDVTGAASLGSVSTGAVSAAATSVTTLAASVSATAPVVTGVVVTGTEYVETKAAVSISSGALALNCAAANIFTVALNQNITSISFSNIPTSGYAYSMSLFFTADGTQRTISWPASVRFPYGVAPTMTATNSKVDTIVLTTYTGGTTWFGFVAGQNS